MKSAQIERLLLTGKPTFRVSLGEPKDNSESRELRFARFLSSHFSDRGGESDPSWNARHKSAQKVQHLCMRPNDDKRRSSRLVFAIDRTIGAFFIYLGLRLATAEHR